MASNHTEPEHGSQSQSPAVPVESGSGPGSLQQPQPEQQQQQQHPPEPQANVEPPAAEVATETSAPADTVVVAPAPAVAPVDSSDTDSKPGAVQTTTETIAVTEGGGDVSDRTVDDIKKNTNPAEAETETDDDPGPELAITLLLTTGARHPLRINGGYLRKQGVTVEADDPFSMSVYTLKELIWREWRSEWEPRPASPSSIRLISFGKLLDDKSPISESKFNRDAPNVVHMTVKPQEVVDEEDAKGSKQLTGRERETPERSPRCCIIL